jgi:ABC-type glycerol-3-phosphate transport system permease component
MTRHQTRGAATPATRHHMALLGARAGEWSDPAPLWKSLVVASGVARLALTLAGPTAYSLAQLPVSWCLIAMCGLWISHTLPSQP